MEFLKSTEDELKKMTKSDLLRGIELIKKTQHDYLSLSSVKDLIKEAIGNVTDELHDIKQQLKIINNENIELRNDRNLNNIITDRVEKLERQSYDTAQYVVRRNNIEISGIPEIFKEDVLEDKMIEICAAYGVAVKKRDIEACHRLPKTKGAVFNIAFSLFLFITLTDEEELTWEPDKTYTYNEVCAQRHIDCSSYRIDIKGGVKNLKLFGSIDTDDGDSKKTFYLNFYFDESTGLCLAEDSENKLCPPENRFSTSQSAFPFFSHINRVKISANMSKPPADTPRTMYINKNFFKELFPEVEDMEIILESPDDITLPITKKNLKTLVVKNAGFVRVDPSMLPIKDRFSFVDNQKHDYMKKNIVIQPIKIGNRLRKFTIDVAGRDGKIIKISMPKSSPTTVINNFVLIYRQIRLENLEIDYTEMQGKINTAEINFRNDKRVIPIPLKSILPPAYTLPTTINYSRYFHVSLLSLDECATTLKYEILEWPFPSTIDDYHKIVIKDTEQLTSLAVTAPHSSRPESANEDEIILDFIIVSIDSLMRIIADSSKKYTVNTFYLVVSDILPEVFTRNTIKISIKFEYLVTGNSKKTFMLEKVQYAHEEKVEYLTFSQDSQLIKKWKLTLLTTYQMIVQIAQVVKLSISTETSSFLELKRNITSTMKRKIESKEVTGHLPNQNNYVDDAMYKIKDLFLFAATQSLKAKKLPRLSTNLYKEKTLVYHEMAKNIIAVERLTDVKEGQKFLLDITKMKSGTQISIAKEQQKILENREENSLKALFEMKIIRLKHKKEVRTTSIAFNEGVEYRQRRAWFDVALGIFNAVVGVFSGNIGAISEIGELAGKLIELSQTMAKIAKLIERIKMIVEALGGLANAIGDGERDIRMAKAGYGADLDMVVQEEINYAKRDTSSKSFDPSQVNNILDQLSKLNAADVLKWTEAEAQVVSMIDGSVTGEVPEAKAYKFAMLKMVAAGKAETEAGIKYAQLKSDIYMNRYRIYAYEMESKSIDAASKKLKQTHHANDYKTNIKLSKIQLKMDLFLHMFDYCQASFYYNFQPCLVLNEFSFDASLSQMMYISNKMLVESIENLNDLYPPPQTFQDISIKFTLDPDCDKVVSALDSIFQSNACKNMSSPECRNATNNSTKHLSLVIKASDGRKRREIEANDSDESSMNSFAYIGKMDSYKNDQPFDSTITYSKRSPASTKSTAILQSTPSPAQELLQAKVRGKYVECISSSIHELIKTGATTISVKLDNEAFKNFNRVRISEMKVFLDGVESAESLEVKIESEGIFEDRFKNETFLFVGEEWKRVFRYEVKGKKGERNYQVKADVAKEFANKFNAPTPFTSWIIKISGNIDMSNLKSIEMLFSGSMMSS